MSDGGRVREPEAGLVALSGRRADGVGEAPAVAGKVWLVGAGPGDPELLTVKALRVLQSADVLVYDRLIPDAVLNLAPATARRLYVGKRKSFHSVPQDDLNDLLVALGGEGLQVVRLKGGDPFVFGRGGEELLACREAGLACEVIPGISAALAASASVGAPLTHRRLAQAVTFVTGHAAVKAGEDAGFAEPNLDWAALAKANHTIVIYMGLSTAPTISARLIAAGRAPSTPVLMVENVSQPSERRAVVTLATLPQAATTFSAPTVLIVGEVAALADIEAPADHAAAPDLISEKRA